jgi:hypothetical protein
MFHRKFWILGVAALTIGLLSVVGSANAGSYDNQVIKAGRVKIIRNSGRGTKIEMNKLQMDSEAPLRQPTKGYWYNQYIRNSRTFSPSNSSTMTTTITSPTGSSSSYQSNFSSHSTGSGSSSSQTTKLEGQSYGTVTRFSLDDE